MARENRTRHLNAKVSPTEDARFRAAAQARGLTVSEAMREALSAYGRAVASASESDERPGGPGAVEDPAGQERSVAGV